MNKIATAIRRQSGVRFSNSALRTALSAWASDPASGVVAVRGGKGYTTAHKTHAVTPRHGGHADGTAAQPGMAADESPQSHSTEPDPPCREADGTARHGAMPPSPPYEVGGTAGTGGHPEPDDYGDQLVTEHLEANK